jgi:hypothetical protein
MLIKAFSFLFPDGKKIKKSPFAGFIGLPIMPGPSGPEVPGSAGQTPQMPGGQDLQALLQQLRG